MKPQPALDLDDFRRQARMQKNQRAKARASYEEQAEKAADADREYRITLAKVFTEAKAEGISVAEAELRAAAEAADWKHARAIAESLARSALLHIEAIERDAATLRSIYESGRREGLA